jgi:putative transposase
MVIERPRVRDATKVGFESQVLGTGVARTPALEALVICSFLRGLSVQDVERALEECFGEQVIAKSTVARVCKDVAARYAAWCERDLAMHDIVYCYLDAIYLKLRSTDEPAEGVLVAWGITLEGQKVLLGLQLGCRESYESWLDLRPRSDGRRDDGACVDRRRRRAGHLEGHPRVVGARRRAALHSSRAQEHHVQAARALTSRG